jgi:hypothetical protein
MRDRFLSSDDQLLARLHAAPDLRDGIEALAFWQERRRRLAWYRPRGRREATRMILRWERRLRNAVISQPGVPISLRASAGLLVARTHMRRWSRRGVIVASVIVGVTVMAAPFVAAVALLLHIL